ncbi:hypothetical protein LBMAG51_11670 [Phycisphaerae bacterium]|nr:hypothetical protein LBMAG51_11670 [Phycisphaerae bacterium]
MSRPSATTSRTRVPASRKVDRIESDSKDPRWAKIFVDGVTRAVARLPRESLTELRIRDGMSWTAAVAKRVAQFNIRREAREYSMGMLARSTQNGTTIAQRLERRGFESVVINETIALLKADGWLNDDTHAVIRADSVSRSRPGLSADFLSQSLEWEGVDSARAQREARRVAGNLDSRKQALALARKAIRERGRRTALAVAATLLRKGIESTIIEDALRKEGIEFDE